LSATRGVTSIVFSGKSAPCYAALITLPSISLVVPNFNGGATLEAALVSLIGQEYPRLEILVVDGGSTDNSLEIICRFEKQISWWISEKDSGQSEAINKGLARATGDIVNWFCSDDILCPGALLTVGKAFIDEAKPDLVVGACQLRYIGQPERDRLHTAYADMIALMPCINPIVQPSCFFRRALLGRTPVLDPDLHFAMDFELWNYFVRQGAKWKFIPETLSVMNFSDSNKTSTGRVKITREYEAIYKRYVNEIIPLTYWHRRLRYPLERIRHRHRGRLFAYLIYFPWQCAIIAALSPFYGFRRVRWMNWTEFG
jgi:glycosyltransferase involved in cell wall biosynthesis